MKESISIVIIKIKIVGLGKSYNLKDEIFQNKNIEIINQINDNDLCILYSNAKMLLFPTIQSCAMCT